MYRLSTLPPRPDPPEMGSSPAAAILLAATLARAVLLPAAMTRLGDWTRYLPSWLGWLPRPEPGECLRYFADSALPEPYVGRKREIEAKHGRYQSESSGEVLT